MPYVRALSLVNVVRNNEESALNLNTPAALRLEGSVHFTVRSSVFPAILDILKVSVPAPPDES